MSRPHSDERGASAILVAASLLVLIGFVAIAVDSGLAYDERRQEQGSVDAGVLSAGLASKALPTQTGCSSTGDLRRKAACNGAMVAIEVINQNSDAPFTTTDFADAGRCTTAVFGSEYDPDANGNGSWNAGIDAVIPITSSGQSLSCIRYTANMSKVRILLPVTNVDTTFGRVLGRSNIAISALAEAELVPTPGQGIFPFAVGPTGGGANHTCLFSQSTSNLDAYPCNGPVDGNFGLLGPQTYGDTARNTPVICNSANESDRIASGMAGGADHIYATDADVPGVANDTAECPNKAQWIDQVDVRTGNLSNAMQSGLLGSIWGVEGRLLCKDGDAAEPTWHETDLVSSGTPACVSINNSLPENVDNTPLWKFIDSGANAEASGSVCNTGFVTDKSKMEACLGGWRAWPVTHTVDLFTSDIASSPRFGWVPRLAADPGTGGSGYYMIVDFLPVYVQTIYLKCNSSSCDVVFDPGESSVGACATLAQSCGFPSSGNKTVEAMTAMVLRRDMLPASLRDFPFAKDKVHINLSD